MLSLSDVLLLGTGVIAVYVLHQLVTHPLAAYPGPALAKFTNFWRLWTFTKGAQHLVDHDLHQKYGPIVRDGPNSLLVADINVFKSIYGFNNALEKGDFYLSSSSKNPLDSNVFSARTEAQHKEAKKKLVPPALSAKSLMQYEAYVTRNVEKYGANLHKEIRNGKGKVDVTSGIERLTFDAMLEATYGTSMGFIDAGYDKNGTIADKGNIFFMSIAPGLVPWLARLFGSGPIEKLLRKPKLDKNGDPKGITAAIIWSVAMVNAAVENTQSLQPSMLKSLLNVSTTDKRKPTLDFVRHECFNVVFAGTGSTAAALDAILYRIGSNLKWQSIVHDELQALPIYGSLSNGSLSELPKLNALIKETLRLHPPFEAPFERVVTNSTNETVIPGLKGPLPAGTRLWSNAYIICRTPEVFGPDANEFRPERWLESPPERLREMEDVYCVFGRGSRACIGKDLALMVMRKTVATVLHRWEISCPKGSLKGDNAFEMHYKSLPMSFTERSRTA
ncbi:MAG: hypothetical protein M4579_001433 [Chaenotheca gracillima]|nr:MAG: hypothetical protein M4579_001433 [Chaenotheca gracillima]